MGDVIVVYNGDTDAVMGGKKERVDVNIRTGGTWGGAVALDAGGDIHYGNPNVVKGPLTDDMHIVWQQTLNIADPPTAWLQTQARTLRPDDTLSTTVEPSLATNYTASHLLGGQNLVSYDDGGTQRIVGVGLSDTNDLKNVSTTEDGSDDITLTVGDILAEALTDEIFANVEVGICSIAELSGDLHILYSGGGIAGVDQDLYYIKSTDDATTWDTETEEIDAITVNFISANIYVRGADTVLAYVYDDGGVQKYNEKILISGGVSANGAPSITAVTASGTAKKRIPANGTPSIAAITASGTAKKRIPANGSPNIATITSSGTATRRITADGSPSMAAVTVSGTAGFRRFANGSPSMAAVTASGTAGFRRFANGSPSIATITASGTAKKIIPANGTPSIATVTASGSATVRKNANGSASLAPIAASGTARVHKKASGSAIAAAVQGSGASKLHRRATGAATLAAFNAAGSALAFVPIPIIDRITLDARRLAVDLEGRKIAVELIGTIITEELIAIVNSDT